jgi:hypothetical protein
VEVVTLERKPPRVHPTENTYAVIHIDTDGFFNEPGAPENGLLFSDSLPLWEGRTVIVHVEASEQRQQDAATDEAEKEWVKPLPKVL